LDAYNSHDYILTKAELEKAIKDGDGILEACTGENEYYVNEDGMLQSKLTKMIKPPQPKNPITDEVRRKRWEVNLDKKFLKNTKKEELDLLWKQEEEKRLKTIALLNEEEEFERQREIKRIRNIPKQMAIREKMYKMCNMKQRIAELEKKREEAERMRIEEQERKERRQARKEFRAISKFYRRQEDKEGQARREARRLERFLAGLSEESSSSDSEDYDSDSENENENTNDKSNISKKNIRR